MSTTSPALTEESEPEEALPQQAQKRSHALGRWWPFTRDKPLLGLDVGSSVIKVVVLDRRRGQVALKQVALAATPASALKNGALANGPILSDFLRSLFADYRIRTRCVAISAGGEKVYCQAETFPRESDAPADMALERAVQRVVPYSLENAAVDYQELQETSDSKTKRVLWVSTLLEQVDRLRQTVALAGKNPVIVDIEACALVNALTYNYQPAPDDVSVLLHIGARSMTLVLVEGSLLRLSRSVALAAVGRGQDPLPSQVLGYLDRHWETLVETAKPLRLQRIFLSGGGARAPEVGETLHKRSGLRVRELDPFHRIRYSPAGYPGKIIREHGPAMAVAVGLALRSFEDL